VPIFGHPTPACSICSQWRLNLHWPRAWVWFSLSFLGDDIKRRCLDFLYQEKIAIISSYTSTSLVVGHFKLNVIPFGWFACLLLFMHPFLPAFGYHHYWWIHLGLLSLLCAELTAEDIRPWAQCWQILFQHDDWELEWQQKQGGELFLGFGTLIFGSTVYLHLSFPLINFGKLTTPTKPRKCLLIEPEFLLLLVNRNFFIDSFLVTAGIRRLRLLS